MDSTELTGFVGDKIFPDIVPDKDIAGKNLNYPLIVMIRTAITPSYSKGCSSDTATVEIICYANQYFEAVDMAELVRELLDGFSGDVDGTHISDIRLDNAIEGFNETAYFQQLTFNIR